jgi:hypothetical protein
MIRQRALLLVIPLALAPALASAAGPPHMTARLAYQRGPGAEGCPDEAGLRLEVARRSGYDPFTPDAPARLIATVTRQGSEIIGALQFYDDAGTPGWSKAFRVRSNDCGTLIAAMGAEIEYEFSPALAGPRPVGPPPPPPLAAELSLPPAAPPPPPPPAPALFQPVELWAGGLLSAGFAPDIAIGATLGGGYRWRVFSLAAELRFFAPASGSVAALPGARVSTVSIGGAVIPCARIAPVFGCVVVSLADVFGSSTGVDVRRAASGAYVGAGLRAGVDAPISPRFALRFSVEGLLTIRSSLLILDGSEVWETSRGTGSVAAALVTYF